MTIESSQAVTIVGAILLATGLLSLMAAHGRWFDRAEGSRVMRAILAPYRLLDKTWVSGDRQRYLHLVGGLLTIIGALTLIRSWL